jgi:hypothetical protein
MSAQRVGSLVRLRGAPAQKESQSRQRKGAFRTQNAGDFGPGGELSVRSKQVGGERKGLMLILTSTSLALAPQMMAKAWSSGVAQDLDPDPTYPL